MGKEEKRRCPTSHCSARLWSAGEQGACCACHTRGSAPCTVGAAGFAVGWWPVHKTVSGGSQMSWGSGPQFSTPEASSCSPVRGDRSVCHTSPAMSVPPEREFPPFLSPSPPCLCVPSDTGAPVLAVGTRSGAALLVRSDAGPALLVPCPRQLRCPHCPQGAGRLLGGHE